MGKINPISDEMLRIVRKHLRKEGKTLVRNKKTGVMFERELTKKPKPADSEALAKERAFFIDSSRKASQWIKANNEKACPPNGTPEYQEMMKSFKRQDKIKRLLNFVMSRIRQLEKPLPTVHQDE